MNGSPIRDKVSVPVLFGKYRSKLYCKDFFTMDKTNMRKNIITKEDLENDDAYMAVSGH